MLPLEIERNDFGAHLRHCRGRDDEHRERDLRHVGPHEVDLAAIAAHVADFRAGRDGVEAPLVDYPSDSFRIQRHDFAPLAALAGLQELEAPLHVTAAKDDRARIASAVARSADMSSSPSSAVPPRMQSSDRGWTYARPPGCSSSRIDSWRPGFVTRTI